MNIKLCLESTEIIDLGVVDWVNGEPSNIAEGKVDVARELRTVNGITYPQHKVDQVVQAEVPW